MKAILFFDGAARCNPGPAGAGWVIKDKNGRIIKRGNKYLGEKSNNFAEYSALIIGLKEAAELKIKELIVAGDSNLVISQLKGDFKVKTKHLRPLFNEALEIMEEFKEVDLNWIPRKENYEADEESNLAIDNHIRQSGGVLGNILNKHKFKR